MTCLGVADHMAKKVGRPRTSTGEGPPVRLEADIHSMAKYIAAHRGIPVSKLASELLRPVVEREFAKLGRMLAKDAPKAEQVVEGQ